MSDELTMQTKGIRGLIKALEVEKPDQPMAEIYKANPNNVLANEHGVPVMPIYRIVEVVLAAALPEGDLFMWCPDCDGAGEVETVSADPILSTHMTLCTRCGDHNGKVKIERDTE